MDKDLINNCLMTGSILIAVATLMLGIRGCQNEYCRHMEKMAELGFEEHQAFGNAACLWKKVKSNEDHTVDQSR